MKRKCLGCGASVGTFPKPLLLPLQPQEPSEDNTSFQTSLAHLTRASHSRISLAPMRIYPVEMTEAVQDQDLARGTGMHQLVISDQKGGAFSLDSYSVHYKVFILLVYYVCLYLGLCQRHLKKNVLVFQKHLGRGCFSPFNDYIFYALVFYVGVISRFD